jgi:FixJ family two-component response regulator
MASAARIVYVVDADDGVRQALARLLHAAGLEARTCESVAALQRDTVGEAAACVVLDLSGSARLGETARAGLSGRAGTMPIIAMSALDDADTRRLARELGAQAFFRKPVDGAALVDAIAWATRTESVQPAR